MIGTKEVINVGRKKHMRIWGGYSTMTPDKTHISTASTFASQAVYM